MYCNKCGNQLSENELVCQKCGNAIEKNNSRSKTTFNRQQFTPKQSTANYTQAQTIQSSQKFDILKLFMLIGNIIGIISGILSIIFGIIIKNHFYNISYIQSTSYGGDAYTGIQNAAADTGNNIRGLFYVIHDGLVFLLIIIGLISIATFLTKTLYIIRDINDKNKRF